MNACKALYPGAPSLPLLDKAGAPGLDIYVLYYEWRSYMESLGKPPKSFDAAFLGFCKKRAISRK